MREILRIATKEVLRRRRDPFSVVLWILTPLSLAAVFAVVFGGLGRSGVPRAKLLVADVDDSFVSGLLRNAFDAGPLAEVVKTEAVTEEEGLRMIAKGNASALLVIPEGFERAFLDGTPATLRLVKNPMESVRPGICENVLEAVLDVAFLVRTLFDEPIGVISDAAREGAELPGGTLDELSLDIGRTMQRVQGYLFPPLVEVKVESLKRSERERIDFTAAYYPGLVLMALLFVCVSVSQDMWREKRYGTLARSIMSPMSLFNFFAGKLLGGLITAALVLGVMIAAGPALSPVRWHHLWAVVVLGLALAALLLAAFSVIVLALSRSERTSNLTADVLLMALLLTSGTTVPLDVMPASMVKVASFSPIGHVLLIYRGLVRDEMQTGVVLVTAVAYLAAAGLLGVLAGRSLFPRFASR